MFDLRTVTGKGQEIGFAHHLVVKDREGLQLAYVYFEDEPARRSAAKLLTHDEVRRIAVNIAKSQQTRARREAAGG